MSKHIKTSDSDTFNLNELLIHIDPTSSTAQGGGGSFKNRKPMEKLVDVNHGWQSEATDGLKGD